MQLYLLNYFQVPMTNFPLANYSNLNTTFWQDLIIIVRIGARTTFPSMAPTVPIIVFWNMMVAHNSNHCGKIPLS